MCIYIDIWEEKKDGKCNKCKDIISSDGAYYYYCANEIFGSLETSKMNCLRCNNLEDFLKALNVKKVFLFHLNHE